MCTTQQAIILYSVTCCSLIGQISIKTILLTNLCNRLIKLKNNWHNISRIPECHVFKLFVGHVFVLASRLHFYFCPQIVRLSIIIFSYPLYVYSKFIILNNTTFKFRLYHQILWGFLVLI